MKKLYSIFSLILLIQGCGFNYRQKAKIDDLLGKADIRMEECVRSSFKEACFQAQSLIRSARTELWRMKDGRFGVRVP